MRSEITSLFFLLLLLLLLLLFVCVCVCVCFGGSYVVFLSSAWKNVGMTVTCNRCDVMNIM